MSVFQINDWWSVRMNEEEEFDAGCMIVGNIDNSVPPVDKILVGSMQGMVRMYFPSKQQFRVEDLVHEDSLGLPILQLSLGRFIPSARDRLGVAVLHPRKLTVYEIIPQGGQNGRINFYKMDRLYEHHLGMDGKHFTAYNMTHGPFGGVDGRDMIMVQSMDGKLQVLEQSANAFSRQLVDCVLPGPISYLTHQDAFITANYANRLECYRYQVLANSQSEIGSNGKEQKASREGKDSKSDAEVNAFGLIAIRNALVDWSLNLGESCRQIVEGKFSKGDKRMADELMIVTDRSLYLVKDTGMLVQQRRLDSDPVCAAAYPVGVGQGHNLLLASRDKTIQIFADLTLVWSAKVRSVPVSVSVASFGGQKGLIVSLDDEGLLSIGYLGTKPPINAVYSRVRELDYDKIDEEHRHLLQIIRETQTETKTEPKDVLVVKSQVSKSLDMDAPVNPGELPTDLVSLSQTQSILIKASVRLFLSYNGVGPASNVSISVSAPSFVHVSPSNVVLQKVQGAQSTPTIVKLYFYATKTFTPSVLDADIMISYTTAKGEPRVTSHIVTLPMMLACKLRPPTKSAPFKVVLDTDIEAQSLLDLFDDFLYASQESGVDVREMLGASATHAMGFQFWSSESIKKTNSDGTAVVYEQPATASILVSKTAGRYRIQGDSMACLGIIAAELEKRLTAKIREITSEYSKGGNRGGSSPVRVVTYSEQLPVGDLFSAIELHYSTRQKIQSLLSDLNDCSHQFRMIQKRLLVRFKDRNPTPLGGLDSLMRETYSSLLALGDEVQEEQLKLRKQTVSLECLCRLMSLLTAMRFELDAAEHRMLEGFLCPDLRDGSDQGWEETVDASLTYLLKTCMAKHVKESATITNPIEMSDDVEKLKKHFSMVLDRISKGAKLIRPTLSPSKGGGREVEVEDDGEDP